MIRPTDSVRLVDRPLVLGLVLGLIFGIADLLLTWMDPLADDGTIGGLSAARSPARA